MITDRCGPKVCSFADSLARSLLWVNFLPPGLPFSTSRIPSRTRVSVSANLALRKTMSLDSEARGDENMVENKKSLTYGWWLTTEKWTAEKQYPGFPTDTTASRDTLYVYILDSAFLFRNKQISTKKRRATKRPMSGGEWSMVRAKLTSGRGGDETLEAIFCPQGAYRK